MKTTFDPFHRQCAPLVIALQPRVADVRYYPPCAVLPPSMTSEVPVKKG
jgi:hypothetical protein